MTVLKMNIESRLPDTVKRTPSACKYVRQGLNNEHSRLICNIYAYASLLSRSSPTGFYRTSNTGKSF